MSVDGIFMVKRNHPSLHNSLSFKKVEYRNKFMLYQSYFCRSHVKGNKTDREGEEFFIEQLRFE